MRKITFGLFLFIGSLFTLSTQAQTTIFSEDFSSITTGNNTSTSGSSNEWTAGNENFPAANLVKVYQAGGAIKLGTGSVVGSITTIPLDLSQGGGNFTLMFDVKGWTTVESDIIVTITGQEDAIIEYTEVMAGTFETKTLNYTGGVANATIKLETTAKRAFIDNIIVQVGGGCDIEAPVAEAQAFCGTATVAELEAIGDEGADFLWYTEETGGTALVETDVVTTGTYYVSQMVEECESERLPVSITVNAIPDAPVTGPLTFCNEGTVAELSATGTDVLWYTEETGGTALAETTGLATATYYASQTVNGCESGRVAVQVTVNVTPAPEVVEAEQTVCEGGIVADLEAEGEGLLWYSVPVDGTALNPADALTEGTYYVSQTLNECEGPRAEVTVVISTVEAPVGETVQTFNEGQTLADLAVTGEDLEWFADAELTIELDEETVLEDGVTYYVVNENDFDCISEALAVTVTEVLSSPAHAFNGFSYHPNPVSSVLTISNNEEITSVQVYNMLGQVVLSQELNVTSAQVNMSSLTAGSYFVKLSAGAQAKTIKVVKQ